MFITFNLAIVNLWQKSQGDENGSKSLQGMVSKIQGRSLYEAVSDCMTNCLFHLVISKAHRMQGVITELSSSSTLVLFQASSNTLNGISCESQKSTRHLRLIPSLIHPSPTHY